MSSDLVFIFLLFSTMTALGLILLVFGDKLKQKR